MIGGYASIEIVDKQNDLITLKALNEAVDKYMENAKFRNVMTNHSNVQVGEVVKENATIARQPSQPIKAIMRSPSTVYQVQHL